ncbi:alanine dehydrogenase [Labilibacter sediminis]|nr:alanine dehydrogenase [Labilibacter sediminis]
MLIHFTIGIIKETQIPADARVALTPKGAQQLLNINKSLQIIVEPSKDRVFSDEEYMEAGCIIADDLSDCDLLLGIKEVQKESLLEGKTYMFFSHTVKQQAHNKEMLQAIIDKNITLIDYEFLYGAKRNRIAAFGYWAGLAGAYNTLRAYGIKNEFFSLLPLAEIEDTQRMYKELKKVKGGKEKILITGTGRVAKGVEEVLQTCGIYKVDIDGFLHNTYNDPVYFCADPLTYAKSKDGKAFTFKGFIKSPQNFESNFLRFAEVANVFIAAHFWDPSSPKLFELTDLSSEKFNIDLIGDITCDINGSVPTTQQTASIKESFYDYNPHNGEIEKAFSRKENITIMAVDKLPSALPIEASEYFSEQLVNHVLAYFWMGDYKKVLAKATIVKNGKIQKSYKHLCSFIQEKNT